MRNLGHSGKTDANQKAIVSALRKSGLSVQSLAAVGKGCPDVLCSNGARMWMLEIKGPKGKLTDAQVEWIDAWRGPVHIVRTVDEALQLVGVM